MTIVSFLRDQARIQEFSFDRWGPGQTDKKSSDNIFFSPQLIYRSQMVNFKEMYHFLGSRGGQIFFRGVQLFPDGSNCLFPIETHITCDFPGGYWPTRT